MDTQSNNTTPARGDKLSRMVYGHWRQHHPTMFKQFQQENRLETEVEKTAQEMSDFLYDLVIVEKMEYHQAWELMIDQFLLPEERSSSTNQQQQTPPHETSA